MFKVYCFFVSLVSFSSTTCFVDGFAPRSASTGTTTQLCMSSTPPPSRRDVLKNTGTAAATAAASLLINPSAARAVFGAPVTEQSAANKANESYQGVYFDPNHPTGYRVLMAVKGSDNKATMTLSDGVPKGSTDVPKTYRDISVRVDNNNEFVFDFGFKGGPKDIKAKLSPDKQSITFEDGNTWTKNYYKYDGIYKVTSGGDPSLSSDAYRIVRKNGPEIILEVNDTGNPKDTTFVDGSVGSLFSIPTSDLTFYYKGKQAASSAAGYSFADALYDFQRGNDAPTNEYGGTVGQLSLQDKNTVFPYGTITFPDKTVWTRI